MHEVMGRCEEKEYGEQMKYKYSKRENLQTLNKERDGGYIQVTFSKRSWEARRMRGK